jgi:hypothetical protein
VSTRMVHAYLSSFRRRLNVIRVVFVFAKLVEMSFLDSLENSLKALEGTEQSGLDEHKRKDSERRRAAASAPWAERRTKVNFVWIGTTLRLEGRNHRMELRPSPEGIDVVYIKNGVELKQQRIDLNGKPEDILPAWMAMLEVQKKEDDAEAAAAQALEEE